MHAIVVIICHVGDRHASSCPLRGLVFPFGVLELSFEFQLLKRLLLRVEIVLVCQYFIILIFIILALYSDSTRTLSRPAYPTSNPPGPILAQFLRIGCKIDAVRLDPVLAVLIVGLQGSCRIIGRCCHR